MILLKQCLPVIVWKWNPHRWAHVTGTIIDRCTPARPIGKPGLGPRGSNGRLTPCSMVTMVGWRPNNDGLMPEQWWVHLFMWQNNAWNDSLITMIYHYIVDKHVTIWNAQAIKRTLFLKIPPFRRDMNVNAVEPTRVTLFSVSWFKCFISNIFDVMLNYLKHYLCRLP